MKEKKYLLLYRELKERILNGEYQAGQKLPSKRMMTDRSGYSIITVEKAYQLLIDEGYITACQRSGYYVCQLDAFPVKQTKQVVISHLKEPEMSDVKQDFEYSLWFKTVRKVLSEYAQQLFIKSPGQGCAVLRNALSEYLLRYRGMVAQPERIVVGSGSEQLYETVVRLLGRDKIIGIESPSYRQIEAVYRSEGVFLKKLPMGKDGIRSDALWSEEFDVLHVTPFRSYPSGVTASLSKRYEYLKWTENGKYLVEDDFNSEFFIPGQPIESLYKLNHSDCVIYINTFSKSLSPSMRMGYMILPESLMKVYEERLGGFSCSVPVLEQYVLAEFISSGNFERHLNRIRRKMK